MASGADPYESLAEDYHWLFDDEHLTGEYFLDLYRPVLDRLGPGAKLLDCSCGTGLEAAVLARDGFDVSASDASEAMVARARRRIADEGLHVPVTCCSWDELPHHFDERFEAVFCVGNSIAHLKGREPMVAAFEAMRGVVTPGGVLVVESRDWELMRSLRERIELRPRAPVRDGVRGFCLYVWTIPGSIDDEHVAELVIVLERDGRVTHRRVELGFHAYSAADLVARLIAAGFEDVSRHPSGAGRYFVVARKPVLGGRRPS